MSAELNGRFATPTCGDNVAAPPSVALGNDIAGEPGALAIDTGDFIGSSAVGRFSVQHDAAAVAGAAAALGLRAMAVGHRDLSAPREQLLAAAQALHGRDIPYVLTNLACEASARSLCDAVVDSGDDPVILDTPQGRVGYVAVLAPSALRFMARDRAAGLTLQDPKEAVTRATQAARAHGARWVVVAYDPEWPESEAHTLDFARDIPAEGRPDLLLVNGVGDRIASMQASQSGIHVVMTHPGRAVAVELGGAQLTRDARQGTAPAEVTSLASATHDWLCQTQNNPLHGARLTSPMDRDGFTTFMLNVLRDETETEVAIINRGAVARDGFPMNGALTGLNLATALPFDDRIYVGTVRGSVLKDLVTSSRAGRFMIRGVTTEGGVKVNGRDIEADTLYRVVTTGFVFEGGEGGLGATEGVALDPWGSQGPREFMLSWLDRPHEGDITAIPVDPARRTRWTLNASVDLGFNLVNSANPAGGVTAGAAAYANPQLARSDTMALRGDVQFFANANHPDWTLLNNFRARYGRAAVGGGNFEENLDVISLRSNFKYTGFTAHPRPYIPAPDFDLFIESEFDAYPRTRTVPDADLVHHLLLRPTLGLAFTFNDHFSGRIGAGLEERELLRPDDPTYVLVALLRVTPINLFTINHRAAQWNAEAELTVNQAFSDSPNGPMARDGMLRVTTRLFLPIYDTLAMTTTYDLFGRLQRGNELGIAHDLSIGVAWTWGRAIQTFR